MEIDRKYALNKKRLTKKEVQEILATNPALDVELSKPFEWTWANTGYVQQNKLYKLPDDKYLFVFDPKDGSTPNRGDIYSKDTVLKWVRKMKRSDSDNEMGLWSSGHYWQHFSKLGVKLIDHTDKLRIDLSEKLKIPIDKLDNSYESLDLISEKLHPLEHEFIRENYMDELTSYIGEVLLRRVKGHWAISEKNPVFNETPFISIDVKSISYNPINVIYVCLLSIDEIDLRKETANEVRSQTSRLAYEKHMAQFRQT